MAARSAAEEIERLQLSDEDTEDLWDSPSKRGAKTGLKPRSSDEIPLPQPQTSHSGGDTLFDRQEAREAALHNELQSVRNINEVLEGLLKSIDRAKGNMKVRYYHLATLETSNDFRPSPTQLHPRRPSSTHGLVFCPKPSTTSG